MISVESFLNFLTVGIGECAAPGQDYTTATVVLRFQS